MKRFCNLLSLSLAIMFLSLVGCTHSVVMGRNFDTSLVQNIKKDSTTKKEIIEMFGEPSGGKQILGDREIWTYQYNAATASAGLISVKTESSGYKSLSVTFQKNVVTDFTYTETAPPVFQ